MRMWISVASSSTRTAVGATPPPPAEPPPLSFILLGLSTAAYGVVKEGEANGPSPPPCSPWWTVVVLLTAVFATSTVSGIQKGIKWLSELNVWLTLAMAAGLLLLGPGFWLIQHFFSGFFTYLVHLPQMALAPNAAPTNWVNGWTVFYWGWFLGYAPLMGLFTAGVSRGRSIRELVLAVAILCNCDALVQPRHGV